MTTIQPFDKVTYEVTTDDGITYTYGATVLVVINNGTDTTYRICLEGIQDCIEVTAGEITKI